MRLTPRRAALATAAVGAVRADGPVGFAGRVASIPGMLRDTLTGRWRGLGRGKLALMVLGVLYLVSPIDLMPEALLTIPGLADDAVVAAWLVAALLSATGDYRDWRLGIVPGGYRIDDVTVVRDDAPRVVPGTVVAPAAPPRR